MMEPEQWLVYATHCMIQTVSGVHPASISIVTVETFLDGKMAGPWVWQLTSI